MLATIFRSVIRQARRHPLYVGLNVFGLALGIGVFLALALLVRFEYSYNSGLKDVDCLVRVDGISTEPGTARAEYDSVTFRALPFLRQDFPEIVDAARIKPEDVQIKQKDELASLDATLADPSILRMFGIRLAAGRDDALTRPDGLVLSGAAATRLFGTSDVLGRTVTIDRSGVISKHVVTAIMNRARGPNFLADLEMIIPIPPEDERTRSCFTSWGSDCGSVYLRLRRPSDIASVQSRLRDFIIRRASGSGSDDSSLGTHPEETFALNLLPMRNARFYDANVVEASNGADRNVIDGIGLVGLLALALACANTVNLSTARSVLRAREVAIRKTLGGMRSALFAQFVGEAVVLTAISGVLGLALCEVLVPEAATLTGESLAIPYGFVLAVLPLIVLGCGMASGIYPALVLSGTRPAAVLAAAKMPSGGRAAVRLRDGLVIAQFTIAVTIVIGMVVIHRQTGFLRSADSGFARSGLLIGRAIPIKDVTIQRRVREALRLVAGVQSVAYGKLAPNPNSTSQSDYSYVGSHGTIRVHLLRDVVDGGYWNTYRPRLIAGRWFDDIHGQDVWPTYGKDVHDAVGNVVINSTAALRFGFATPADAIGKVIDARWVHATIVGVVADMRFGSPRDPVYPGVIAYDPLKGRPYEGPIPAVRFTGVPEQEMERRLDRAWTSVLPDVSAHFQAANERMEDYFRADEQRGRIFALGAVAAVVIAALGLYGLAAFAAARRLHEIGIRKTLGATSGQVIALLLRDFLRPVIIACVIACPIGWAIMRDWLSGFDERITLGPVSFLIAVAGALAIATLTVLGQTLRLSRAEPARALRAE
jgi:putative ABC transport system permease protein